jgi:hypothetical protein
MDPLDHEHVSRSVSELGEPDALFRISRARFLTKLAIGCGMVVLGLIANYLWWIEGPGRVEHYMLVLLLGSPLMGMYLLMHMFRQRGLVILIYPTGLLRICRGEIASFPWDEVAEVRVKVQRSDAPEIIREPDGTLVACWLPAESPALKIWNCGLLVQRADGVEAQFSAALTDYVVLAEEVQRRTFAEQWPRLWDRFLSGLPISFGDLEVSTAGVRYAGKIVRWNELKEVSIQQGKLRLKSRGKWFPTQLVDIYSIPNPHLFFALVREAQRVALV